MSCGGVRSSSRRGAASRGPPIVRMTVHTPVSRVPAATERRTAAASRAPKARAVGIAKPRCESPREPEQQEQHASRRADRREGVDAELPTHDDRIDEVVELLHDVAEEERDGEHDDDAPRAARRQGGGHGGDSRRRRTVWEGCRKGVGCLDADRSVYRIDSGILFPFAQSNPRISRSSEAGVSRAVPAGTERATDPQRAGEAGVESSCRRSAGVTE